MLRNCLAAASDCSHIAALVPKPQNFDVVDLPCHGVKKGKSIVVSVAILGFTFDVQALNDCIASASCCVGCSVAWYNFFQAYSATLPAPASNGIPVATPHNIAQAVPTALDNLLGSSTVTLSAY